MILVAHVSEMKKVSKVTKTFNLIEKGFKKTDFISHLVLLSQQNINAIHIHTYAVITEMCIQIKCTTLLVLKGQHPNTYIHMSSLHDL